MAAARHNTCDREWDRELPDFVDQFYRHVLFITYACFEAGIGERHKWAALAGKNFNAYFSDHIPEEGKSFLRGKFQQEPIFNDENDLDCAYHCASITRHFYKTFGLGTPPDWVSKVKYLPASSLYDAAQLTDRLVRHTIDTPNSRRQHIMALVAAKHARDNGSDRLLEQNDYAAVGRLTKAGLAHANRLLQTCELS
jgi:hypothetical protein